jgi:hypothetical protein
MTRSSGWAFNASGHRGAPRQTAGSGRRRVEVGEQGLTRWLSMTGVWWVSLWLHFVLNQPLFSEGWLIGVFRIRVRSFCSGFSCSLWRSGPGPGFAEECIRKQAPDSRCCGWQLAPIGLPALCAGATAAGDCPKIKGNQSLTARDRCMTL